jgi:hypothetical protein
MTRRVCPLRLPTFRQDGMAQRWIKAASCAVARRLPSGEKAVETARFGLKVITGCKLLPSTFQSFKWLFSR